MHNIEPDAATMNALFDALGATVMSIAAVLTPEQKERLADNLARLAVAAEKQGNTLLETALIDLQAAARR